MNNNIVLADSPLSDFDYSFDSYLQKKKAHFAANMDGHGLPNYAYKLDYELRQVLDATPGLFQIARNITATYAGRIMQQENMHSLAVGPNQFPEIYKIGCDCAKKLGIAVPNIYVQPSEVLNAYAYITDGQEPFIVVTSLLVKRMTLGELKVVIGHECGHIQNLHSTYTLLCTLLFQGGLIGGNILTGGALAPLAGLLTEGMKMTLSAWSRAAEVTADRAGMICCDDLEDAYSVNKKFLYGAVEVEDKIDTSLQTESLREQMQMTMNNPMRLLELTSSHPLPIKRVFAEMEFAECETFYKWRPDMQTPGCTMRSKEVVDRRCKNYIDVIKGKGDRK